MWKGFPKQEGLSLEEFNEITSENHHIKGAVLGDLQNGYINSGQVAGSIDSIPTVNELLEYDGRSKRTNG